MASHQYGSDKNVQLSIGEDSNPDEDSIQAER